MRAYHESEIAHKGQTFEVIKTLLTLVVAAYGGLIALILKAELAPLSAQLAAVVLLVGVFVMVVFVVRKTNAKIDSDHTSYERHRDEYLAERKVLDLDSALESVGHHTHWTPRPVAAPTGFFHSKNLTVTLGAIVVLAAVFGAFLAGVASETLEPDAEPAPPPAADPALRRALATVRAADPGTVHWTIHSFETDGDRGGRSIVLIREGRDDGYVAVMRSDASSVVSLQSTTIRQRKSTVVAMSLQDVQARLRQLGAYTGQIDGTMGPRTISALRRFQQAHGLAVTGEPDADTVRLLAQHSAP